MGMAYCHWKLIAAPVGESSLVTPYFLHTDSTRRLIVLIGQIND